MKECILSGLLSVDGLKVLHMDRNNYYGGDSASLTLEQLWTKMGAAGSPPERLGRPRDWNVDLVPKFIMANGLLVKMLIHTDVTRYLEFRSVAGSFVYKDKAIHKVPVTDSEALKSSLMGLFQKRHCKNFLTYVQDVDTNNPATWKSYKLDRMPMGELMNAFSLDDNTKSFIGHAAALHTTDNYLREPALETVRRIKLYADSLMRYGKSPYIYPLYGLGELPQAFARLAAIYGGTYMLDKKVEEIVVEDGKVVGVRAEGEVVKCKKVVCDPSYAPKLVKQVGFIVRSICLLDHPIPNTGGLDSVQIILPQRAVNRHHDVYLSCYGAGHKTAPEKFYIAIASTTVESTPETAERELASAFELMGPALHRFTSVSPVMAPVDEGSASGIFVTESYDATSHFETTTVDVMKVYKRMTGKEVDLSPPKKQDEQ